MSTASIVLRRSHRKSTQGCESCKRRRIKCDELRPICQRCQKGSRTCIYPIPERVQGAGKVSWPSVIEDTCKRWKEHGHSPFHLLTLTKSLHWHTISMTELKYLYQMGLVESILRLTGTSNMCPPWDDVPAPSMFRLANSFDFVAYALVAASATRLATISKSEEAARDAEKYSDLAIKGILGAFQALTEENAEAILGTALCCSFTTSNVRSLMVIAECSSRLSFEMRKWSKPLLFQHPFPDIGVSHNFQVPNLSPRTASIRWHDNLRITEISNLLTEGVNALNRVARCFRDDLSHSAVIRTMRDTLRVAQGRLQTDITPTEQYRMILPFTSWFSRDDSACYIAIAKKDPPVLTFLLHLYAVILALLLALPATDVSLFASVRAKGVLYICETLKEKQSFWCVPCNELNSVDRLTVFPLNAVRVYQRHGRGYQDAGP